MPIVTFVTVFGGDSVHVVCSFQILSDPIGRAMIAPDFRSWCRDSVNLITLQLNLARFCESPKESVDD
ncbi:MAG TPA: hypothetical protein DGZ24_01415 [Rhodospirillaceae bacterium]|nr:hypothetical protein [Rhodospirillaceae bacterium]